MLIVVRRGHYATAPAPHDAFGKQPLAHLEGPSRPPTDASAARDHEILDGVEANPLGPWREHGIDPGTGRCFDDILDHIEAPDLGDEGRDRVFEGNVGRICPRPDAALQAGGH